jgi:hypothetical protein
MRRSKATEHVDCAWFKSTGGRIMAAATNITMIQIREKV